jgi:hypothetical protein
LLLYGKPYTIAAKPEENSMLNVAVIGAGTGGDAWTVPLAS